MTMLSDLISNDLTDLKSDFRRASQEGFGTPQEISDRSENSVRKFLEKYLLGSNTVTKGIIRDSLGECSSKQIDAVILSENHPDLKRQGIISFIMADEVTCGIEIKKTLNKNSLRTALQQITSIKELEISNKKYTQFGPYRHELDDWESKIKSRIPAGIFCLKIQSKKEIIKNIFEYYRENAIPTSKWLDFIISLDGFLLTTFGYGHSLTPLNDAVFGAGISTRTIITSGEFEEKILEYFLSIIVKICEDYRIGFSKTASIKYYIENYFTSKIEQSKYEQNTHIFLKNGTNLNEIEENPGYYTSLSDWDKISG